MDSLTHLATGIITPLAFRKAPRTAALLLFGVAAGQLPDIDLLAGNSPHALFTLHRGATHSLVALALFALLLALLLKFFLAHLRLREMTVRIEAGEAVINKADDWSLPQMFVAALLGLSLHVYLDCMTTFGTQIFWPFLDYRVALPALFIVDFTFTVPLVLIMFYCLAGYKKEDKLSKQLKWARLGLMWAICYPLACLGLNTGLTYVYNKDFTEVGTAVEKIHLTPVLGSPFFWKAVAENEREYHLAWIAAYKPPKKLELAAGSYPKPDKVKWARLRQRLPIFNEFAKFAGFATVAESGRDDNVVEYTYRDLRYIYSVPNFILERSGVRGGLFNMQTRKDANTGQIFAWRYLKEGGDANALWTAVRPPVNLED